MGDGSPTRVASSPGFVQSLSNPKYVKKVLNIRVCKYLGCSIGQSVDKFWIFLSNLCPKPINLDRISTSVRQRLDRPCTIFTIGQTLDRIQTDIGQRLDFMSKVCPTAVQPPIVKEDLRTCEFVLLESYWSNQFAGTSLSMVLGRSWAQDWKIPRAHYPSWWLETCVNNKINDNLSRKQTKYN